MNLDSSITDRLVDIVKQGNIEELEKVLKNSTEPVTISTELYIIAFKNRNTDIFNILSEYDSKENIKLLVENHPIIFNYIIKTWTLEKTQKILASNFEKRCPSSLKTLIRNDMPDKIHLNTLKSLLSRNTINFFEFILDDYVFDNKFIIELLHCYRQRQPLSTSELRKRIHHEISKVSFGDIYDELFYDCLQHYEVENQFISLFDYLCRHPNINNKPLDVNRKDEIGNTIFYMFIYHNKYDAIKMLIEYAEKFNILLDLNDAMEDGETLIFACCSQGPERFPIIQLLMDYAEKHHIVIDLNKKDDFGQYPLHFVVNYNDIDITKRFMDYARKNNFILNFDAVHGDSLSRLVHQNENFDMFELLVKYANENNFKLHCDFVMWLGDCGNFFDKQLEMYLMMNSELVDDCTDYFVCDG